MAKYTVELNEIVRSGLKIFNFDYEFYDATQKADFEKKFINHFMFSEIGFETVGRFQHYLKCKCDETLPYYNMLFRTSLMDYEKLINYYMTETNNKEQTRINDVLGNSRVDGSTSDEKTSELESVTNRDENVDITKNETLTETNTNNKNATVTNNNKLVESDTPNGLLEMVDIKNNVYASKANVEDNSALTVDVQTATASKVDELTDGTIRTGTDDVTATSTDTASGEFSNDVISSQNTTENLNENQSKTVSGNVGVRSDAEMLEHHIKLQKTLSTIHLKFFEECNDLFMQIY